MSRKRARPLPEPQTNAKTLRAVAASMAGVALLAAVMSGLGYWWASRSGPLVTMYRQAGCECCMRWAQHLREAGFRVDVRDDEPIVDVRARLGVPEALAACHTATVGRYVIEGHVPAADIHRLLEQHSDLRGLAVPGMPAGSPGMEGAHAERYEVLGMAGDGTQRVVARHGPERDDG